MKRREFITLISGAAVTWPLAAQRSNRPSTPRCRAVAVVGNGRDTQHQRAAYRLRDLGYVDGRNVTIENSR